MSRTRKGSKPPGLEWWTRRPVSMVAPTRYGKIRTHRVERLQGRREARAEREAYEPDELLCPGIN